MSNLNTKLWGTWEFLSTLCAIAADYKYPPSSLPETCFCWGSPQSPQDAHLSLLAVDIFSNLSTKLFIFAFQDILRVRYWKPPPPTELNQIAILWQYPTKSRTKHTHAKFSQIFCNIFICYFTVKMECPKMRKQRQCFPAFTTPCLIWGKYSVFIFDVLHQYLC